ncbi:hypothetical protein A6U86_05710 [Rhizobium sp. AC27/96]|uniref:hypothetical protein n=1 Tax=Rhizobium sp. AC27/96 TaxID=1841653 RepID=UPI0008290C19|nr:hypothetical protein [Rhizobium sp. AC27/96]OCJ12519.1 hypothetical protein A6U86_05710 [Rhizobium sp. AC27/96]
MADALEELKVIGLHMHTTSKALNRAIREIQRLQAQNATIRCETIEEAAKVAERLGSPLVRGESGPEYVNGNCDIAAAIRSLAKAKEADHG